MGGPGVQTLKRNFPLKHKTVGPVSLSPLWCPLSPLRPHISPSASSSFWSLFHFHRLNDYQLYTFYLQHGRGRRKAEPPEKKEEAPAWAHPSNCQQELQLQTFISIIWIHLTYESF